MYLTACLGGKEQSSACVKHLCTGCSVKQPFENQKQRAMFASALLRIEISELLEKMQVSVSLSGKKRGGGHKTAHIQVESDNFVLYK